MQDCPPLRRVAIIENVKVRIGAGVELAWRLAERRGVSNFTARNTSTYMHSIDTYAYTLSRVVVPMSPLETLGKEGTEGKVFDVPLVVLVSLVVAPPPTSYASFTIVKRRTIASRAGYVFRDAGFSAGFSLRNSRRSTND